MSSLESSKTLALVGSILLILNVIPYGGAAFSIIGIILLLVAIKGFADYYRDNEMYRNAFTGVIYYVIAAIAAAIALGSLAFGLATIFFAIVGIAVFIVTLIIAFIFYLLAAMRLRQTFFSLAQKTGEHNFETAGRLLWIGAILTIIFVGLIIIFVAWIFAAIGFFSMKVPGQQYGYTPPPPPTASQPSQPTQATRYCPNCGSPVAQDATFCPNCGKQLPPP